MRYIFFVILILSALQSFSQKSLISYDDIKYLLNNNIHQADTFLVAKGYLVAKKDNDAKNRKYALTLPGGTHNNISLRADGRRLFIEIETNELNQYNLIRESISQYLIKDGMRADVQTYTVKELGNIYITINDTMPYDPMRKDYDIQVVGDKHITAYN
jgi:predicted house-cleaning NTP pyrophosphatase (Maf/HAM1 superfamily)